MMSLFYFSHNTVKSSSRLIQMFSSYSLTLSQTDLVFTCLQYKSFENTPVKGEIARDEQYLPFLLFSALLENFLPFSSNLKLFSAISFSLEES